MKHRPLITNSAIEGMRRFPNRPLLTAMIAAGLMVSACSGPSEATPEQIDTPQIRIDFDAALRGVRFNPDTTDGNGGNGGHAGQDNGLLDAAEMALVAAVLNDPNLDLSATNGADHRTVSATYDTVRAAALGDVGAMSDRFPTVVDMVTGYVMIGTSSSFDSINHMSGMFGAPLQGDYSAALELGQWFGPEGDADGDGFTNQQEYGVAIVSGVEAYVVAALDPQLTPSADELAQAAARSDAEPRAADTDKTIGIILYPDFEVLDVYGPLEMWSYVREFNIVMIAEEAGPVMSTQGAATIADYSFETAPKLDIIMVPGGVGTSTELQNDAMLDFIRERDSQSELTTSVCTGAALLAKSGILDGHKATTNKRFFYLSSDLDTEVEWVTHARWVDDGKYITSSGVSAGTDMALHLIARLYGKQRAEAIASGVEYEWHDNPDDDPFAEFLRD